MSASEETLTLLRRIAVAVEKLASGGSPSGADIASDRDLDSQYGNPELRLKKMPRDWAGPSYTGRRFSDCPPELLDLVADMFDYFAQKAEETGETHNGKPVAPYKRKDAARARGWAKRIRDGKHTPAEPPTVPDFPDDDFAAPTDGDIPF
jgi:hypothetical protein